MFLLQAKDDFARLPKVFNVVITASIFREKMNDNIGIIQDDPVFVIGSFDDWIVACFKFYFFINSFYQATQKTRAWCSSDDKAICEIGYFGNIQN